MSITTCTKSDAVVRPTNVAIRRVFKRGIPDSAIATVYAFAREARFATDRDVLRFGGKLRRGELVTFQRWGTVAERVGLCDRTIKRHVQAMRGSGSIEVRQVSRTMRLMVFVPADVPAGVPAHKSHQKIRESTPDHQGLADPVERREVPDLGEQRVHPPKQDAPPTERQMALFRLKAERLGLGTAFPPPTRGAMSDWITAMDAAPAHEVTKRVQAENGNLPATPAQEHLLGELGRWRPGMTREEAAVAIDTDDDASREDDERAGPIPYRATKGRGTDDQGSQTAGAGTSRQGRGAAERSRRQRGARRSERRARVGCDRVSASQATPA